MLVSVVINNYNYRPYLRDCIDSALNQTYPDLEVIVVDDGSTDGSADVVRAYGTRVVPVLKPNAGQASAFNVGFEASRGDILLFLDSDDLLEPFAAATVVKLLAEADVLKAHWPLRVVDQDGSPTGALKPGPAAELPDGDLRTSVFSRGPTSLLFPPTSGHAWARAFLERVLPMDAGLFHLGADTFLFEVAPFAGRMRRWHVPLSRYRTHPLNRWRRLGFNEILHRELQFYEACVPVALRLAEEQGVSPDPCRWRRHSWWHRLHNAVRRLDAVLAPGRPYLLVDDGTWGLHCSRTRQPRPFPALNGIYRGPPADDQQAIAELERERSAGAGALVLAWPCFWWLEHYQSFARHVTKRYRRIVEDDSLVVFDLETINKVSPSGRTEMGDGLA